MLFARLGSGLWPLAPVLSYRERDHESVLLTFTLNSSATVGLPEAAEEGMRPGDVALETDRLGDAGLGERELVLGRFKVL